MASRLDLPDNVGGDVLCLGGSWTGADLPRIMLLGRVTTRATEVGLLLDSNLLFTKLLHQGDFNWLLVKREDSEANLLLGLISGKG